MHLDIQCRSISQNIEGQSRCYLRNTPLKAYTIFSNHHSNLKVFFVLPLNFRFQRHSKNLKRNHK
uniref:DNA-damage-repair/toleration protein DRT100-like n=1 Tax=Rhizophora mucronata TaxID=61149 RepID=A0A2P2KX87_RHIMU